MQKRLLPKSCIPYIYRSTCPIPPPFPLLVSSRRSCHRSYPCRRYALVPSHTLSPCSFLRGVLAIDLIAAEGMRSSGRRWGFRIETCALSPATSSPWGEPMCRLFCTHCRTSSTNRYTHHVFIVHVHRPSIRTRAKLITNQSVLESRGGRIEAAAFAR